MSALFNPKADIVETEAGFQVWLDMPGVAKEDLKVKVEQGQLSIFGKAKAHQGKSFKREYPVGDFSRSFTLGKSVDPSKIEAQYQDGVLRLELAKAEEALPVEVTIN